MSAGKGSIVIPWQALWESRRLTLKGGTRGERAARASEARGQRPGKLLSDAPFTRPGTRSRDWISRLLLLQIASPGSQDNGFEATPCGEVSRRGVGPDTRAERGKEG